MDRKETLAVDIGGPILDAKGGSTPSQYRDASPTPGGFAALRRLKDERFGDRIHLISQCNETIQAVKLDWMARHGFLEATGMTIDRIHFVREPVGKAGVCQWQGVTHFIEDRPLIMSFVLDEVANLYLFRPDPAELAKHPAVAASARIVDGWEALLALLLPPASA
ncbi:MAG TPA: hypothetical protein VL500_01180 [Candidatus Eisenbacteria bacterium]|nr:hypothetical protein [Candidatus Eisenbacteria bacterium]